METEYGKDPLPHHEQQPLCTSRLPYRQGRKLTATKVYTINNESNHLLVFGIPSINIRQETKNLFIKFGKLLKFNITKEYKTEKFTETYHAMYENIRSARIAKKYIDTKNFYGGTLHVCYAPELESIEETRKKLFLRNKDVLSRLKNLETEKNIDKNKTENLNTKEIIQNEINPTIINTNENKTLNMGNENIIYLNNRKRKSNECKINTNKQYTKKNNHVVSTSQNSTKHNESDTNLIQFGTSNMVAGPIYYDNQSSESGTSHNKYSTSNNKYSTSQNKPKETGTSRTEPSTSHNKYSTRQNKPRESGTSHKEPSTSQNEPSTSHKEFSTTDNIEIIDFTSTERDTISNINEALNYNKFGNEVIKKIKNKTLNRIKFNFNK